MFGLIQSPVILEGTLKKHFHNYMNEYPIVVEKIKKDMYVDDLVSGEINVGRTQECHLFQVPGVNYAGPINYRSKNKALHIIILLCCASTAIHSELVPSPLRISTKSYYL